MKPLPAIWLALLLKIQVLPFWLLAAVGCSDSQGDCIAAGTCECTGPEHCPSGEHCVDGHCRLVTGPDKVRRKFGEPCLVDDDCLSAICLPAGPGNGQVCSVRCEDVPCPTGWECKSHRGGGVAERALCVQRINHRLCRACSVSSQCNAIGDLCLQLGDDFVCSVDCSRAECPAGYVCSDAQVGDRVARQCLPAGGSCDCSDQTLGLTRACSEANEHGICHGTQICQAADPLPDWGPCDAAEPANEECDGQDNDCDGLIDTDDPSVDTGQLPADPPYPHCHKGSAQSQCIGLWRCQPNGAGGARWVCGASDSTNEVCNGLDDNCDGVPDDPFVDAEGRYVHPEHCGACGSDCRITTPNLRTDTAGQVLEGAVACRLHAGEPTCVPLLCEPGYYPFPESAPITCAPLISSACQTCTQNVDCRVSSDRCVRVGQDPGGHCAQSCEPSSPYWMCTGEVGVRSCCPEGYRCELFQGQRLCLPEAGTCTCDAERAGEARTCLITGASGEVCQGVQICQPDGDEHAWGECEQADVVVEVCDYLDNNCDGTVDEGFRDEAGAYTSDAHCGACNNNCPAKWDRDIQHAIGGCVQEGSSLTCRIVACTEETHLATPLCRQDDDCQPGGTCDPTLFTCSCPASGCTAACDSAADCTKRFGPSARCDPATSMCLRDVRFHNLNDLEADGCECGELLGDLDLPDTSDAVPAPGWAYVDRDCDGIDGRASKSLFVKAGSAVSQGTWEHPFASIAEALQAFDPSRHEAILVAAGTYRESVVLRSGVRLYGGYSADFAARDVILYPTLIQGQEPDHGDRSHRPGTVNAEDLTAVTVLAGFVVVGYDVNYDPQPGEPAPGSYAIYIRDCDSHLQVRNNWIIGGRGGDGVAGQRGQAGPNGGHGQRGRDSRECANSTDCLDQTNPGGAGGQNPDCSQAAGRPGATARGSNTDPQDYQGGGIDGLGGYNSIYAHSDPSHADLCKYDCQVVSSSTNNGSDAWAGLEGQAGTGGAGCSQTNGAVVDGLWRAVSAADGMAGSSGNGGGGGGAGGAVYNANWGTGCTQGNPFGDLGGSGGGGGAGGCGGTGGRSGGAGGGSFSIFLAYSARPSSLPVIRGNRIRRGFGGRGAAGGSSGQGGLGGQGGPGGEIVHPAWCAGAGGHGGRGGDGGAGGGGGGGCGGASYGIAGQFLDQADYLDHNEFSAPGTADTGGAGGAGGASPAGPSNVGGPGAGGVAGDLGRF